MSLFLVGMQVRLGLRLQSRAVALRRRATIEHLIARISTRFINSRPHEITDHVQRALGELAACVGADRAYFVIDGKPAQAYTWCREGTAFPPGWPETSITPATLFTTTQNPPIHIHNSAALPPVP